MLSLFKNKKKADTKKQSKRYIIDWNKVENVEDIKQILGCTRMQFRSFENILKLQRFFKD